MYIYFIGLYKKQGAHSWIFVIREYARVVRIVIQTRSGIRRGKVPLKPKEGAAINRTGGHV